LARVPTARAQAITWLTSQRVTALDAARKIEAGWPPPELEGEQKALVTALHRYAAIMGARHRALTAAPVPWKGRPVRPGSPGDVIRRYFEAHDSPADALAIAAWAHNTGISADVPLDRLKHLISMALSKERLAGRIERTTTGWYQPARLEPR
jgi:hypothetical protein